MALPFQRAIRCRICDDPAVKKKSGSISKIEPLSLYLANQPFEILALGEIKRDRMVSALLQFLDNLRINACIERGVSNGFLEGAYLESFRLTL